MVGMHEFNLLPPCLREVAEHELRAVDTDTLAAYTHLPAEVHRRSYWIKVSSFQALQRAVAASSADVREERRTTPLCVFLMPSIPLADAQHIFTLMTGETEPLVFESAESAELELEVVVCYHDLVGRDS